MNLVDGGKSAQKSSAKRTPKTDAKKPSADDK